MQVSQIKKENFLLTTIRSYNLPEFAALQLLFQIPNLIFGNVSSKFFYQTSLRLVKCRVEISFSSCKATVIRLIRLSGSLSLMRCRKESSKNLLLGNLVNNAVSLKTRICYLGRPVRCVTFLICQVVVFAPLLTFFRELLLGCSG